MGRLDPHVREEFVVQLFESAKNRAKYAQSIDNCTRSYPPNHRVTGSGKPQSIFFGRTQGVAVSDTFPRVAYRLWQFQTAQTARLPLGSCVVSLCGVRGCANPLHLVLGTRADAVPIGEEQKTAKLTESQVLDILQSSQPATDLAREYQVGATTIRNIRAGVSWKHLRTLPSSSPSQAANP